MEPKELNQNESISGTTAADDLGHHSGPVALKAQATGSHALGAQAIGALAVGAMAVAVVAIGRLAIGKLFVRKAKFVTLEIDELSIKRLRVDELIVTDKDLSKNKLINSKYDTLVLKNCTSGQVS